MRIFDIFFPQRAKCIFCNDENDKFGICDNCYESLPWIIGNTCEKCGGHVVADEKICDQCKDYNHVFKINYSIFDYDDVIAKKIIEFKQSRYKHIGEVFADIVLDFYEKLNLKVDIVIPVPIHENRYRDRGFNQSQILASKIDDVYSGLVDNNVLKRIKDTPHQTGLSRNNRQENLNKAFEVIDKKKIKGKKILLIDDIYTTGSTLDECTTTLLKAGAKSVVSLCLARGIVYKDENKNG